MQLKLFAMACSESCYSPFLMSNKKKQNILFDTTKTVLMDNKKLKKLQLKY